MKKLIVFLVPVMASITAFAQIDAGLFRYPDVSATDIVFTYANDLWIIPKTGGTAVKLSSPAGVESFPKFSPDGKKVAFTGNYDGNADAYVIPTSGGVPVRLTSHGYPDRVVDWTIDGSKVLFASSRESGKARFNQFYTVSPAGGPADKLPLAYAEYSSFSPDGKKIAVVIRSERLRNWKRYRGGNAADIHIYDFANKTSENISSGDDAPYDFPMWRSGSIYFLSDRGPEQRANIWKYDVANKALTQITKYTDYDVHFPSQGPEDIVYEAGGKLYILPFATLQPKVVNVNLVTDKALLKPRLESAERHIQSVALSPDGNRALLQARGNIFSVPAEHGFVKDLTHTSGVAERYPAWSPDGRSIAYWSDKSGEYELYIRQVDDEGSERKVTNYGPGFRYTPYWSPDSRKIAFIDKAMKIQVVDVISGQTIQIDKGLRMMHGPLNGFTVRWSPDSRYLTYNRDLDNYQQAVFIYDYNNKKLHQVTSGFYSSFSPVFDPEGKYLYLLTSRSFQPIYSSIDNSFIYANSGQVAAIALLKTTPSLLVPKNDTVALKLDAPAKKEELISKAEKERKDTALKVKPLPSANNVLIDFDGLEQRMVILPLAAGNYAQLNAAKGKLIYMKYLNAGTPGPGAIKYFDIDKREEKTILDNANGYLLSDNKGKILAVRPNFQYAIIQPAENQKFEKPLRVAEMQTMVDPAAEWKQIYMDAWRIQRDYFYDPNMHGVDWNQVRDRYAKMLEGATTREEANFVIGEMIGELNASHTYFSGGDLERSKTQNTGYLGVDYEPDGEYYKIKKIIRGAAYDAEARSPLDISGIDAKEGMYILAVNGLPLTTAQDPYAAFEGLAGKAVEITYNTKPSFSGAKTVTVQLLGDEYRLRHLAWINEMAKKVSEATNDEIGYIYVPSTGVEGQNELIRQFNAQWQKKGLIIDERFNDGGQIPDRFIEILNRDPLASWAIRDGSPWPWPPYAHFGPKVMLMNGWSGSGGDAFPDYFRRKGLGPLIGTRTWGGLIGISGTPPLIDGGNVTAPSFRMYNPDGTWFREGHGVDPDIPVDENLGAMARGVDPQLERAIEEIKTLLKKKEYKRPEAPKVEKRGF
ncbi:MAG TPA: PDZ domain-containing protein [Chitinophagaceae bacterium]|nr:PDZ domain-containing protein [Chitinophagaceae bacterium]